MDLNEKVDNHEKRILHLESNYSELRNGQLRLENTVLNEFNESKNLTRILIEKQFNISEKKLTSKEKVILALITMISGFVGVGGGFVIIMEVFFK